MSSSADHEQYNRAVARLQDVIALKNERLSAKDIEISKLNREIIQKQQGIEDRDAALRAQKQATTQTHKLKDSIISKQSLEIKQKEQAIEDRDTALVAQKQVITDTHRILAAQQETIKALTIKLEDQQKEAPKLIDRTTQTSETERPFGDRSFEPEDSATKRPVKTTAELPDIKSENINERPANFKNAIDINTQERPLFSGGNTYVAVEPADAPLFFMRRRYPKKKKNVGEKETTRQFLEQEVIQKITTKSEGTSENKLNVGTGHSSFNTKETNSQADLSQRGGNFAREPGISSIMDENHNVAPLLISKQQAPEDEHEEGSYQTLLAGESSTAIRPPSLIDQPRSSRTNEAEYTKPDIEEIANQNRRNAVEWNWGGTAKFLGLCRGSPRCPDP